MVAENINKSLIKAAYEGNAARVRQYLKKGADIHTQNDRALYLAVLHGHTETTALLLKGGADIHARNGEMLSTAASSGYLETVELLLNAGADIHTQQEQALRSAASSGHLETVELLLKAGADIHTQQEQVLHSATGRGHMEVVALLLEKRVDSHDLNEARRVANKAGHMEIVSLLDMHQRLDEFSGAARPIAYQAGAIGVQLGLKGEDIVRFAASIAERSLSDTEAARRRKDKPIDPLFDLRLEERARRQPLAMSGINGYLEAGGVRDLAAEYADCVLLPQLMWDANLKADAKLSYETHDSLRSMAGRLLFKEMRLDEILGMARAWHINGNAIPDALRPLRGGRWQQLIDPVITAIRNAEDETLVVRALDSQVALVRETRALKHCVGKSDYGSRCREGEIHILSVQTEEGKPLATAEVKLSGNPKTPLEVVQFRGLKNVNPSTEARQAMDWFLTALKDGRVHLRQPIDGKWGEIHQENSVPPLIARIGFDPTKDPQSIQRCLDHYHEHLLLKDKHLTTSRREGGFSQPRRIEETYRWRHSVRNDLKKALLQEGLMEEWPALVNAARKYNGLSPIAEERML